LRRVALGRDLHVAPALQDEDRAAHLGEERERVAPEVADEPRACRQEASELGRDVSGIERLALHHGVEEAVDLAPVALELVRSGAGLTLPEEELLAQELLERTAGRRHEHDR